MKPSLVLLAVAAFVLAACSGITRTRATATPQLGVSTSGAPTQPGLATQAGPTQVGSITSTPQSTKEPEPTEEPTASLPEDIILLPTAARPGQAPPPNTPAPVFPPGQLEATLAAQPPVAPSVVIYNAVFQRYEHGAMIYIAETREIYVMIEGEGKRGGPFYRFDDFFQDGDPEEIPDLPIPPGLLQPHRGFGRIWREQPGLRVQIGWAADFERPFTMQAARVASGAFDASGNFIANANIWMMTLHDNSILYLNEATNTWAIGSNE